MKANALLVVERDPAGRSVVRTLRSSAPLTLLPARGRPAVHLVNSAAGPLGGDELTLTVRVGPGACLTLTGVAATVALPGPAPVSRVTVHLDLAESATVDYLPEPTIVTRRAHHESALTVTLGPGAHLRTRETVVLGRANEPPGTLTTTLDVTRVGSPVLRQQVAVTTESLLGKRVMATELSTSDTRGPASGTWWARTSLAEGGSLTTSLADDAITALACLAGSSHAQSTD